MKRKVIQLAAKTLVVSLPSKWVKKQEIHKGDEVEVSEHLRGLLIAGKGEGGTSRISVDVSGLDERVVRWVLTACHKKGFDEIELIYSEQKAAAAIQDMLKNELIGFTITEQTERRSVLRSMSKEIEEEFDTAFRRAFLVTVNMGESAAKMIEAGKLDELCSLLSLESTNNQLTAFCERLLNKKEYKQPDKSHFLYVIIWNLEKVCDEHKHICSYLANESTLTPGRDVIELYKNSNKLMRGYYDLFYEFSLKKLNELNSLRKELLAEAKRMLTAKGNREIIVVSHLANFVTKVSDFSASIVALNVH